jgi:hypothetical protein
MKRKPVDHALVLKMIPLKFADGKTSEARAEGNNAAWPCECGTLLVGRCYFQFGDTCRTECPPATTRSGRSQSSSRRRNHYTKAGRATWPPRRRSAERCTRPKRNLGQGTKVAKRKSAEDKRREDREQEREEYQNFVGGINAMASLDEVRALVNRPGRVEGHFGRFLANIAFFLGHDFAVPAGATRKELGLYEGLIERLGGALPDRNQIIARLQAARQEPGRRL